MEKNNKRVKKIVITFITFFTLVISNLFSQVPSLQEKIRIQLWGDLEAYPEIAAEVEREIENSQDPITIKNGIYDYPIKQIKRIAPFIISGMVYGFEFIYVPSDKARGVQEYFELIPIQSISERQIMYSKPWINDNRFFCWCEFERNPDQIKNYNMWASIIHPVLSARGYGLISEGFDGITAAVEDGIKTAVREHYRGKVKNKPKEISGSVLLKSEPLLGIDAGRYAINLDFFLEYSKIIEYTAF